MGGMAELFLAQEPPRPGLLVIKRILPYLSEEPEFVQMFLDEARIAAQLHHPNIVQVFELGRINESIFIAMEYVEGVDLRRLLAEEAKFSSAVPYAVAARICADVAAGLDHAHAAKGMDDKPLGLIHRDVSPQNVMVAYNGDVKLVDFGIAKAEAIAERSKPGVIKGKFLYLSPEQVLQEKLDHRLDIFALGVMLYEVTTGRAPFARPTTEGILYAIRSESPSPPHLIRDDYPTELSRIVMKCLVKDRNQRYQRASQVQADLEAFLTSGALKQSADVAAYAARLLGGEEERTVLHVPIPGARKDSVATVASGGLVARPTRRPSGQNLPSAVDEEGDEPATEMARPPRKRPAAVVVEDEDEAPRDEEDEDDEPTAMRTMPGRLMPSSSGTAVARPPPRTVSGESTLQDRPPRGAPPPPPRRPTAARKSLSPPNSLASLDRRRAPPVPEEDEEELSESAESITASTLNDRKPVRPPTSLRAAVPLDPDNDTGGSAVSSTESLPRSSSDLDAQDEAMEDDESTAGYDTSTDADHTPAPRPVVARAPRRSRGLMIALAVFVVLVLAALAWMLLFSQAAPPPDAEASNLPVQPPVKRKPPEQAPPSTPDLGPKPTVASQAPASGTAAPPPPANPPTGSSTGVGATATGVGSSPTSTDLAATPKTPGTTAPTGGDTSPPVVAQAASNKVRVQFQAPSRTVLKVEGQRVPPNTFLELEPGSVQVFVRCPGIGAPQWTRNYTVASSPTKEVTIPLDCHQRGHR